MDNKKKQLQIDVLSAFGSESGTRALEHLRQFCGYDRSSFQESATATAFLEGRRSVYLHIKALMEGAGKESNGRTGSSGSGE
jgi:hypothetical protein